MGCLHARVLLLHLRRACGRLLSPPISMLFSPFGIWSHPPNLLSLGKYQPPHTHTHTWFYLGPSSTPITSVSSPAQGHPRCTRALDIRPTLGALSDLDHRPGGSLTRANSPPGSPALKHCPSQSFLESSLPQLQAEGKGFSCLVFSLVF